MNWKNIGQKIGQMAPTLGLVLGGPAGAAAGTLIASALGTSNNPDAVAAALEADPNAMLKLKELQMTHEVKLQELIISAEQHRMSVDAAQYAAEVKDRESARTYAATQPNDYVRPLITFTLLLGAILILALIFSGLASELLTDPTATLTIGTVIGFWFNELKQTLAFYFGTTKDGANQTRDLMSFATSPGTLTDGSELKKEKKA